MKVGSDLLVRAWVLGLNIPALLLTISMTGGKLDNSAGVLIYKKENVNKKYLIK